MEFVEKNLDWIVDGLKDFDGVFSFRSQSELDVLHVALRPRLLSLRYSPCHSEHYFIFDCPGQAELSSHHTGLRNVTRALTAASYQVGSVSLTAESPCESLLMTIQFVRDLPCVSNSSLRSTSWTHSTAGQWTCRCFQVNTAIRV